MTTIVTFKTPDGIVQAADSAMTTRKAKLGANRYDSYEKLCQVGRLPVVVAMWGSALTGGRTVANLVRHFAWTRGYDDPSESEWTMAALAEELAEYVLGVLEEGTDCGCRASKLDLLLSGYSKGRPFPEQWHLRFPKGTVKRRYGERALAISWDGVTEDIRTLWWGHHPSLGRILSKHGLSQDEQQAVLKDLEARAAWGPERVDFAMPLADAARLVEFLVWVQVTAERFRPGLARSAGPIDVVVVRQEGVTWLRRKSLHRLLGDESWVSPA